MEQFAAFNLLKTKTDLAFIDYQVCQTCGFRLMRVETTTIHDQTLISTHCPICGLILNESGVFPGKKLSAQEREAAFDQWLEDHELNREILKRHYRLDIDSFFMDEKSSLAIWRQ